MKLFKILLYSALVLLVFGCVANLSQQTSSAQVIGNHASLPRLVAMPSGETLMSWVEPASEGHVLKFAVQKDGQWGRQGVVASGKNWLINWADLQKNYTVKISKPLLFSKSTPYLSKYICSRQH